MTKKDFANRIRSFIEGGLIEEALNFLANEIDEFAPYLYIEVALLKSQYNTAKNDYIVKGILERGEYDRFMARINYAILDLVKQTENKSEKTNAISNGRLLYKIASKMPVNLENKCIVRIAFNDEILLRDTTTDNETKIQNIQIAEIMSVELIDTNEIDVFKIRTYTDDEQFIVSNEYTQWIFLVKPQKEGVHSLTLKIAVVELINGKERKRNIIVEKEVIITSKIDVREELGFEKSNIAFLFPISHSIRKKESDDKSATVNEKPKFARKKILSFLVLLLLSMIAFIFSLFKHSTHEYYNTTIEINKDLRDIAPELNQEKMHLYRLLDSIYLRISEIQYYEQEPQMGKGSNAPEPEEKLLLQYKTDSIKSRLSEINIVIDSLVKNVKPNK